MARLLAALLIAGLVPPTWVALEGGADVDVFSFRFEFYGALGPCIALAGSLVLGIVSGLATPGSTARPRILASLAFLALSLALVVSWTPGFETDWLSIHDPARPAVIGLVFLVAAFLLRTERLSISRGLGTGVAGLALGVAATAAVLAADRADLARRIPLSGPSANSADVILLLVDTLRADALGTYGANPSPSPFIDGLAERSVVFERAVSQAPWTGPSVSSLFSSLYVTSFSRDPWSLVVRLPEGLPWLPEELRRAGYHTAAFVKNGLLQRGTRFERGFQVHEWVRGDNAEDASASQLVDAILRWGDVVADRRSKTPEGDPRAFFLYAHFMDPHIRYRPPSRFMPKDGENEYRGPIDGGNRSLTAAGRQPGGPRPEDLARARALYQGEVAYLDHQLQRLRRGLGERGLWSDETVVLVIADHGEQFWEHGAFFHRQVHWENLHVPFLLRAPGLAPRRIPEPVAMLDLAPTVLDLLGLEVPVAMEGQSRLQRARGSPSLPGFVISEKGSRTPVTRVTGRDWSLITRDTDEWLESPDGELIPADEATGETGAALAKLRAARRRFHGRTLFAPNGRLERLTVDGDTVRRLEAIGYVERREEAPAGPRPEAAAASERR